MGLHFTYSLPTGMPECSIQSRHCYPQSCFTHFNTIVTQPYVFNDPAQVSFADTVACQRKTQAMYHGNDMTYTQNSTAHPAMSMPTLGEPDLLMEPFNPNQGTNIRTQAALFAPSQATRFIPFVNAQPVPGPQHVQLPTKMDMANTSMAQKHHYHQQWRHSALQQPQMQQHQQQNTNMGHQHLPLQNCARAQQQFQQHQYERLPSRMWLPPQQRQQQFDSPRGYTISSHPLTPAQIPKQFSRSAAPESRGLAMQTPQKPPTSGHFNTTQQFSQHQPGRSTMPRLATVANGLPSPAATPVQRSHAPRVINLITPSPSPQYKAASSTFTDVMHRNELAEHARLEKGRKSQRERFEKRREELRKDTNAIYHSYNEVLEYFPLGRGEHSNPYLARLIASQPMPAEPTSDRGLAISYAKRHWQSFLEMQDLEYVTDRAKAELAEQAEQRQMLL